MKPGNIRLDQGDYKYTYQKQSPAAWIAVIYWYWTCSVSLNNYLRREDPLCVSNQTIDNYSYIRNSRAKLFWS